MWRAPLLPDYKITVVLRRYLIQHQGIDTSQPGPFQKPLTHCIHRIGPALNVYLNMAFNCVSYPAASAGDFRLPPGFSTKKNALHPALYQPPASNELFFI